MVCATLAILSIVCFADSVMIEEMEFQTTVRTGHTIPFQSSFRRQYNQQLFTGTSGLPLSLNVDAKAIWASGFGVCIGGGTSKYRMCDGPISLRLYDVTAGPLYARRFGCAGKSSAIASISFGPSWALTTCEYEQTDNGTVYSTVKETIVKRSITTQLGIDIQHNVLEWLVLGYFMSFSYQKFDEPSRGGLGNLGGLNIGMSMSIIE